MHFPNEIIFVASFLLMLSVYAGAASSRIGAPLLLSFLFIGMLFGEGGPGGIVFNDMRTAYLIGTVSLAVILFDGGFRTSAATFRRALGPALSLATGGVLITAALVGVFVAWLLNVPILHSLLFGAILGSTDAAAVFLLLNQKGARLNEKIRSVLEVESGINDPMAVFLTVALVELLMIPEAHPWTWFIGLFLQQMIIGAAMGYVGGRLLTLLLNNARLITGLYPIVVLAASLLIYSGTGLIGGSGFLAVYIAGMLLGNAAFRYKELTRRFYDGLAWLAQIAMFLMIGLLVTPAQLLPQLETSLLIALVLLFIARPAATFVSLWPYPLAIREKAFLSWVGLRGAVPIFLAIIPALAGMDDSRTYFNIAFVVVVLSLLLQGWTVFVAARLLRLEFTPAPADKTEA